MMPRIEVDSPSTSTSADAPVRRAPGVVLGLSQPYGSASPRGNSYYSRALRCSREHALASVVRLRPKRDDDALTTGWLGHHALEAYYRTIQAEQHAPGHGVEWARQQPGGVDPATRARAEQAAYDAVAPMETEPGYADTYATLLTCLRSYFDFCRADRWFILAVEEQLASTHPILYTARLDLVVINLGNTPDEDVVLLPEHKFLRAITADTLSGYQLNLQTLGQSWLYLHCVDVARYPRFGGVLVNITSKTKIPKHMRVEVPPTAAGLRAFERAVQGYEEILDTAQKLDYPPNLTACSGATRGFRACSFYNLCFSRPDLSVERLLEEPEPPYGFVRDESADDTDEEA
jgi:hypothetical protein